MEKYYMDAVNKTLIITAAFDKKLQKTNGDEYELYMKLMSDIPGLKIQRKTHSSPKSYTNSQGEKTRCNQFKNLTYENMERFIRGLPQREELTSSFEFLKNCASFPQTSRYAIVRRWFAAQFPNYRKNPVFYLKNNVNLIDLASFLEEAQAEIESKAAANS